jgi:plasmid maintenance system antidote protein VapI
MIDRIREMMNAKELTPSQFADFIQVPRAVISHILSGRNKPSLDVVLKIISSFPDLDLRWLLMGEQGELIKLALAERKISKASPSPADWAHLNEDGIISKGEGKMQKEEILSASIPSAQEKPREIERVVFFYSDKSFSEYRPNKESSTK